MIHRDLELEVIIEKLNSVMNKVKGKARGSLVPLNQRKWAIDELLDLFATDEIVDYLKNQALPFCSIKTQNDFCEEFVYHFELENYWDCGVDGCIEKLKDCFDIFECPLYDMANDFYEDIERYGWSEGQQIAWDSIISEYFADFELDSDNWEDFGQYLCVNYEMKKRDTKLATLLG